jgi:sec-independent protein translocase protein TatA
MIRLDIHYTTDMSIGARKMNIFGIGMPEMGLIMVVALLIFGPKKLPEIGRSLGKTIRSFQQAANEFQTEFKRESDQLEQVVKTEPKQIEAATSQPNPPSSLPTN